MNRSNGHDDTVELPTPRPDALPHRATRGQTAEIHFISVLSRMHPATKLELARLMLVAHIVTTGEHHCVLEDSDFIVTIARRIQPPSC